MPLNDEQRKFLQSGLELTRAKEMDCDEFVETLAAYLDDGLEQAKRTLIEHHREICPECEEQLQLLLTGLERSIPERT